MAEPQTPNVGLIVPNTGDLPGLWGSQALNPDFLVLDGYQAGLTTIALSGTPVVLTSPAGFADTPSAGPTQAQNALLRFTGTLTANVTVSLPLPGFYIVENLCTVGAFAVILSSDVAGNVIGIPTNRKCHIFNDGTNVDFVDLPGEIGSYMDLASTSIPSWIGACTIPPWLNCVGQTFSAATYPTLAAVLGGTTLPDSRGRGRFTLNQGTSRITNNGDGIDGNTLIAVGGRQAILQGNFPSLNLNVSIAAGQGLHSHIISNGVLTNVASGGAAAGGGIYQVLSGTQGSVLPAMTGTAASGGSNLNYLPPGYVGGLTLIRAG